MPIRLLALDLDGTLLNSRGQVSERNRKALEQTRKRGVRVAIVTGRRFRDARPTALELGLDVPVIAHNGALTKHARTLETVAVLPLPLIAARCALEVGRAADANALLSDDHEGLGVLVYDHLSGDNHAAQLYVNWSRRIHGENGQDAVRQVASLEEFLNHDPVHLAFSGGCAKMKTLENLLLEELGTTVKIFSTTYRTKDFTLLDVVHPEASKGLGVAAAAAELGVLREEVMAVGDNLNDLEMLHYAGIGVVMENAEASLHEAEGLYATGTNDDDGVALAIERFILQPAKL
ncbi:MAG: Cof-type HAD-IIB family hydrolase [Acidobacteriota bacterium]|nr:Cof-type HAD-IIB family hydrolase [Acidobacteriota bacterium]